VHGRARRDDHGLVRHERSGADGLPRAVDAAGESMWRMPLLEDLRDQLKSDCADLKHTGDRYGGSITAALFMREFIGKTRRTGSTATSPAPP
jgi:leucyl aminopeptidase